MKSTPCARQRCKRPARVNGLCKPHLVMQEDTDFSLAIRLRDRECMASKMKGPWPVMHCKGVLQCAHLISRRYHLTRWYDRNAVGLCAAHHRWLDLHPAHKEIICEQWLGSEGYHALRMVAIGKP